MRPSDVVLDVKHLARPRLYDGAISKEQPFREWRFTLENYLTLIDETYIEEMDDAETKEHPLAWAEDAGDQIKKRGRALYAMLASLTQGRALRIVQGVKGRNGYEAWRLLVREFEPKKASRKLGLLTNILKPAFKPDQDVNKWRENYTKWLQDVDHYETTAETPLDPTIKIAVVIEHVPGDLQTHLQVNGASYENDFEKLHNMVASYVDAR